METRYEKSGNKVIRKIETITQESYSDYTIDQIDSIIKGLQEQIVEWKALKSQANQLGINE